MMHTDAASEDGLSDPGAPVCPDNVTQLALPTPPFPTFQNSSASNPTNITVSPSAVRSPSFPPETVNSSSGGPGRDLHSRCAVTLEHEILEQARMNAVQFR